MVCLEDLSIQYIYFLKNAICQSYTVQRNACPYVETLLVIKENNILDTLSTQSLVHSRFHRNLKTLIGQGNSWQIQVLPK